MVDPWRLERLLGEAIARLDPSIDFRVLGPSEYPGTFRVVLQGRGLTAAWLSVGWPRQVREVLARSDRPDLVAASELSPGARHMLEAEGVSWLDATGAARIKLPEMLVVLSGASSSIRPARANLGWTPATLAVSEALLTGTSGTVAAVSKATGLAASTTSMSLKFLQEEQHLDAKVERGPQAHRTVTDFDDLLDAYAAAAARMRNPVSIRVGVLWRDPARDCARLGKQLDAAAIDWSATSALAADVIAPYLTEVAPMEMYVQAKDRADLRHVGRQIDVAEASGGRLLLLPFPTPAASALSKTHKGVRTMCWPRVYADLRSSGVRGEDAAEHLREKVGRSRHV